jgi:3-isopropylmalate/(R)-2-methylmalate dehydratase small subunit
MPLEGGWKTRGKCHLLGNDIPHDGGVIRFDLVTARVQDPAQLIPHLFDEIDPSLKHKLKPGDFIVAGQNFFCGKAHNQGMIAMKALGLRVLCESMPFRSFRAATGVALPCLIRCTGITRLIADGDEIEADFETGMVNNLTANWSKAYPAIPSEIKAIIEEGGMRGMLAAWLRDHPELADVLPSEG